MSVAIIGFGPRGLYSLERLVFQAVNKGKAKDLEIIIFTDKEQLGIGSAWDTNQPDTNLINIDDKSLQELPCREACNIGEITIPKFPSFTEWSIGKLERNANKYIFFSRKILGQYLVERANSISKVLEEIGILKILNERVVDIVWNKKLDYFKITTINSYSYKCKKCLLTLGHLPCEFTDEDKANFDFAKATAFSYVHNPYAHMLNDISADNKNVAVIGLGLTFIDIARLLTENVGGKFVKSDDDFLLKYSASGKEPNQIIPYSFNGLPAMPKPLGLKQDQIYKPSDIVKFDFEAKIKSKLKDSENFSLYDLLETFSEVVAATLNHEDYNLSPQSLKYLTVAWLTCDDLSHPNFLDTSLSFRDYMLESAKMALGKIQPTLDYAFGQIWRQMQPMMYRLFSFSGIEDEVMSEIVTVDERSKRYSYGPPVESILQLIALIDYGLLNTDFVNNPEIVRNKNGWEFTVKNKSICCEILISSVLAGTNLTETEDKLVDSLKDNNYIAQIIEGLGIRVNKYSCADNEYDIPLYAIGRHTKGSILGADAILECFSPDVDNWAKRFIDSHY